MARKVKGMVQLAGITYRIVRVAAGSYSVVRISDDLVEELERELGPGTTRLK